MNTGFKHIFFACLICLALLALLAGGALAMQPDQPDAQDTRQGNTVTAGAAWSVDTWSEFIHGAATGIDIQPPGNARLDGSWWLDVRVNDPSPDAKFSPRATWVLSSSGGVSETIGVIAFADERQADHSPDIFVAQSVNGGRTWLPNVLVDDDCDPNDPPYLDCPGHFGPDLTVRHKDNSLWVAWQQEEAGAGSDTGNIYYAASPDAGSSWPTKGVVTNQTGKQFVPRLAADDSYLYAAWEDESADNGDIAAARYNPDSDAAWGTPVAISDDGSGAEQRDPALTVDSAGNIYATWVDMRDDDDGEIYFSRWLSGTAWASGSWRSAARISPAGIDWADSPDLRAAPDGSLYAAWMERVPTGPSSYDFQIVVAHSSDQGDTWSTAVVHRLRGASATNAHYQSPALGVDFGDRVYVSWLHSPDAQAATSNILIAVSFDQGRTWGQPRPLNGLQQADVESRPTIAVAPDGKTIVAWQDFRLGSSTHIFATGYPSDRYLLRGEYLASGLIGQPVLWGTLTWTATVPAQTGLVLYSRVLISATGWTNWLTHTASGALSHPVGEAIQVRAAFSSTGTATAVLDAIHVTYRVEEHVYLPMVGREE